ncbi:hypothetical protein [Undibacterium sp.]|uniref:hypothetical protein n=1 Tax=Undibacterium sp. TaxID=1914977 RepID=UPI0037509254
MSALARIKAWWKSRQPKRLEELLEVEFDALEVRIRVLSAEMDPGWNQTFFWDNIARVCFKDEGLWTSDSVFISLHNQESVVHVLIEAKGGSEFFGELCNRGLFPENIWRKAMGDTSGGTHCWPPFDK